MGRIDLFLIGKNIPPLAKIMGRRIDLCFNLAILRLSFREFSKNFFFEDYRNERRNDLSLIGKNIPLLVRRRIDLCFNFHCKIRKNFVRIFFFSFWRRLRGWWKESIFFPSIEIPFGEDYEDEEKNRSFQLRYFAFFYRKFRKILFFCWRLRGR